MKGAFLSTALGLFLLAQAAMAQSPPDGLATGHAQPGANEERARISAERSAREAQFNAEDAACYKSFFVNSCLGDVQARRREVMADLRRQDVLLNERERRLKAADQIRRTEEKSTPEAQRAEADKRASALRAFESRVEREKQKEASRASLKTAERGSRDSAAGRARAQEQESASRAARRGAEAAEAEKFRERIAKAEERRAKQVKNLQSQTKPPASPLPVPP